MNVPILTQLVSFIDELFKAHAPEIVAAAASPEVRAVEQTAVTAAVEGAAQSTTADPRIQAGIAAYKALQDFKTAINTPPAPPPAQ